MVRTLRVRECLPHRHILDSRPLDLYLPSPSLNIPAAELADWADTIPYEVLTNINTRAYVG